MGYEPNLIAPNKSGLLQYWKPFLIGNEAFVNLDNCFVQRGNIRKRPGSTVLARVPKWISSTGITNASPPVVTAVGHGLITGDMVFLENVITTNGTITSIVTGITTTINTTGAHGMSAGQTIVTSGTSNVVQASGLPFDGAIYEISSTTATSITILVSTTGTGVSAGSVLLGNLEKKAFQIIKINANSFSLNTLSVPSSAVAASGVAASADIYLPIVGTRTFLVNSNGDEQLIAFIPKKAYLYNTGTFLFTDISFDTSSSAIKWGGAKDDFFYSSNFASVLWATNNVFNTTDQPVGIRFYNGTAASGWQNHQPIIDGSANTLNSSLMILPYKGRLVALNTTEGPGDNSSNITYRNRARWCQLGTPFAGTKPPNIITGITVAGTPATITVAGTTNVATGDIVQFTDILGNVGALLNNKQFTATNTGANTFTVPVNTAGKTYTSGGIVQVMETPATGFSAQINSWRSDVPGRGGFIDADTSERIVSAEIIQDTLIVGFQFSTWRLRYTGNEVLPFIWERISTSLGSEGTFTSIPFDEGKLMISRRGIVRASFNDVERIDLQVPDLVDSIENGSVAEGIQRVQGVRDFDRRMVYWIYGDQASNAQTPNKIICYNYQDNTWSTFTQSFTTLGIYKRTTDNIWSTWTTIWDGDTSTWDTPFDQQGTIIIVAGAVDSRVWQIMNDDVSTDNGVNFNFTITTGLINPYLDSDKRCRLAYYDLYVASTSHGQVTVENYTDDNPSDPWLVRTVDISDTVKTSKYVRVFLGMIARNHQITITLSDAQLEDTNIGGSDFELQGIVFHTRPTGRIKQ